MNKDTAVASILGLVLGLIVAVALWVVPKILPKNTPKAQVQVEDVISDETDNGGSDKVTSGTFTLSTPDDGTIVDSDEITIEGSAPGIQYVIITTATENEIVIPEEDGGFTSTIELTEGGNEIAVTSFTESEKETIMRSVFYTQEDI